jgi:hypothetical protein
MQGSPLHDSIHREAKHTPRLLYHRTRLL